jgi:proton-dependent oligopeptide transporter, POT family
VASGLVSVTTQTAKSDKAFLGHPIGLGWLSASEFWERFSYYGMATMLVLYMVHQLQMPGHVEHVWGFAFFRSIVAHFYHTDSIKGIASGTYGFYGAFVYLTPIMGGIIAERFIGRTTAVTIGASLMALGHFLMTFDQTFLIALLCLLTGVGFFKGNIATQVGDLYGHEDPRRADGFQIYYIGIQIAVIFAPIACSYLANTYGWHWGFGLAGIGMLIGLTVYLSGRKTYPPDPLAMKKAGTERAALDSRGRLAIAILVLLVPVLAVSAVGNQEIFNAYLIWGEPTFNMMFLGFQMPVESLVSLDSIVSTVTMILSILFWRWWAARWREPDELAKIIIGVMISAAGPLALAGAAAQFAVTGHRVSLGWAVAFHILNDIGFANVFPVGLALYTRASPKGYAGIMVPIYYLSLFLCGLGIGWLGGQLEHMSGTSFWLMHAGLIAGAGVVLLAIRITFGRSLTPSYEEPAVAAA